MFIGPYTCPRCSGTNWHRDHLQTSNVGVSTTQLICVRCSEKLRVRSTRQQPDKCLLCRRWTLFTFGKLKPVYREWLRGEPEGTPVWKGK